MRAACYTDAMDIEKAMQFMLDMQAKHEAWLQRHEKAFTRIEAALEAGAARAAQLESSVATDTDLVGRLAQAEIRLAEQISDLKQVQAASEYKHNAHIETVDKLVRRNGHDQPAG